MKNVNRRFHCLILTYGKYQKKTLLKVEIFHLFVQNKYVIVSINFALEKCMPRYISIKNFQPFLFCYFNQVSKSKDLKRRYFALIGLKTNSQNFTLKDMHNMWYIQTLFFGKNVYFVDSRSWSVSYSFKHIDLDSFIGSVDFSLETSFDAVDNDVNFLIMFSFFKKSIKMIILICKVDGKLLQFKIFCSHIDAYTVILVIYSRLTWKYAYIIGLWEFWLLQAG